MEPETVIRAGGLDDAIAFLEEQDPDAEQLPQMTAILGEEDYAVFVNRRTATAYTAGPAWGSSLAQPGEGACDTYTVERMPAARLLTLDLISAALDTAQHTRQDPDLLAEAAEIRAL